MCADVSLERERPPHTPIRQSMSRREFVSIASLMAAGGLLAACRTSRKSEVSSAEEFLDLGTLQHTWTPVRDLQMHSLVSIAPAPHDAPVIVLVHGSGLSGRYMIPTAVELTRDHRVYVPDMPGFGDSDKPDEIFGVPELANWIAAWLPAIGLTRASFLGNSFGCQVIADLAARYPQYVERAVLQGPTTPPGERSWIWQFIRWRQNQRYNPDSLGEVTNVDYKKAGFRRMFRSFLVQLNDRIEDKAAGIHAPVLVVRGEHDPIANQEWCELIVRLAPNARLEIIPGVAHTLCYTAPVQLAEATRKFLRE